MVLALSACQRVPPKQPAPAPIVPAARNAPLPALPALALALAPPASAGPAPAGKSEVLAVSPGAQRAHASLDDAESRIGLSDAELRQLNLAKQRLLAGDAAPLEALDAAFAKARRSYTVQAPETLAQIAARPEVYGNADLWPLIWHANAGTNKPPAPVSAGSQLGYPAHPTAQEAEAAIDYSHSTGIATPAAPRPAPWP
jgi:nucleoid-associated protein YgaU